MGEITLSHMSCDTVRPPNISVAGRQGNGKRRVLTSVFPFNDSCVFEEWQLYAAKDGPVLLFFLFMRFSLIVACLQDCPGVRPRGFSHLSRYLVWSGGIDLTCCQTGATQEATCVHILSHIRASTQTVVLMFASTRMRGDKRQGSGWTDFALFSLL